jgi:multidrug efflux pump subunit AcrA (membrane-fusion protein)
MVDIGRYVSTGTITASIYAVDVAEIRLPLPDDELAFLDLPLDYRGARRSAPGPKVTIRANFAGRAFEWDGRIVRTEGEIDPSTRMVHVVAEVRNPYGRGSDPNRPPLAVGMYVEAEIEGRLVEGVAELPRAALRGRDQVLVVDADNKLRFRTVDLLRATSTSILVRAGLEPGENVCLSPVETATDGMAVRIVDEDNRKAPAEGSAS